MHLAHGCADQGKFPAGVGEYRAAEPLPSGKIPVCGRLRAPPGCPAHTKKPGMVANTINLVTGGLRFAGYAVHGSSTLVPAGAQKTYRPTGHSCTEERNPEVTTEEVCRIRLLVYAPPLLPQQNVILEHVGKNLVDVWQASWNAKARLFKLCREILLFQTAAEHFLKFYNINCWNFVSEKEQMFLDAKAHMVASSYVVSDLQHLRNLHDQFALFAKEKARFGIDIISAARDNFEKIQAETQLQISQKLDTKKCEDVGTKSSIQEILLDGAGVGVRGQGEEKTAASFPSHSQTQISRQEKQIVHCPSVQTPTSFGKSCSENHNFHVQTPQEHQTAEQTVFGFNSRHRFQCAEHSALSQVTSQMPFAGSSGDFNMRKSARDLFQSYFPFSGQGLNGCKSSQELGKFQISSYHCRLLEQCAAMGMRSTHAPETKVAESRNSFGILCGSCLCYSLWKSPIVLTAMLSSGSGRKTRNGRGQEIHDPGGTI
jgi:hypothetical protein